MITSRTTSAASASAALSMLRTAPKRPAAAPKPEIQNVVYIGREQTAKPVDVDEAPDAAKPERASVHNVLFGQAASDSDDSSDDEFLNPDRASLRAMIRESLASSPHHDSARHQRAESRNARVALSDFADSRRALRCSPRILEPVYRNVHWEQLITVTLLLPSR